PGGALRGAGALGADGPRVADVPAGAAVLRIPRDLRAHRTALDGPRPARRSPIRRASAPPLAPRADRPPRGPGAPRTDDAGEIRLPAAREVAEEDDRCRRDDGREP